MQPHQTTEIVLKLPDLESLAPFNRAGCSPLYSSSERESTEWMLSHGIFPNRRSDWLLATHPEFLGAYIYPYADANGLRIATDVLTILFTLDEVTDSQEGQEALPTRNTFVKALTGKSIDVMSPIAVFTKEYVVAPCFVGRSATLEDHVKLRRDNGGVLPAFDAIEVALGITPPKRYSMTEIFTAWFLPQTTWYATQTTSLPTRKSMPSASMAATLSRFSCTKRGLSHQDAIDEVGKLYRKCADTFFDVQSGHAFLWSGSR
ncbi:hypothetical protein ACEPAF_3101 [Sanghuangporus sanghuang]